jgi:SAM-dependent methyltransferase
MNPVWYVDCPNVSAPYVGEDGSFQVSCWIAWPNDSKIEDLEWSDEDLRMLLPLRQEERPDVEGVYAGMRAKGYRGVIALDRVKDRPFLMLTFKCDGKHFEICFPTQRGSQGAFGNKADKWRRIIHLLRCPHCPSGELEISDAAVCSQCKRRFSQSATVVDFTERQLSKWGSSLEKSPQSANYYCPQSLNLIYRNHRGLVLDFGSGIRDRYFDNVVNYEIHPNETVDVLGDGEKVPFADNSFDAVISIAVFEHVRNPFEIAKELLRVLKPGGSIYVQVPFLFHEHGYPSHYYNMTQAGLANLFGKQVEVIDVDVLDYGQPICLLTIFLDQYVRGLPPDVAATFKNMRVEEFLLPYFGYLHHDYVTRLDKETKRKLACVNSLVAQKRA